MVALPLVIAAASSYMAVKSQAAQADYSSKVAAGNATLARQNSIDAALRGEADATRLTSQGSQVISRQRAGAAASGVDVTSGSVLDVLSGSRFANRLDVEKTKYNAAIEGRGYGVQASNFDSQGEMARAAGSYGEIGSVLGGAGTMLNAGYSTGLFPKFGK